ncbi:MAG: molybdopterin adenylyltransferase [Thermoanaerobacteraceae bacterium]|nr:molybdopterin adenylyltransferase [Thermoanaerobacteraceae bacterium]
MIKVGVVTASDKGSRGLREDKSAPVIKEMVGQIDGKVVEYVIVPDEQAEIEKTLVSFSDDLRLDLVFTTGGTGMSPRDVTPEATLNVVDRLVPGIPEAMRARSLEITSRAMLSRAAAGIRGQTLIINLPGSPKAVRECLEVILPALKHGIEILRGEAGECGRS